MPTTADIELLAEEAILRLLIAENPTTDEFPVEYRHDDDTLVYDDRGNISAASHFHGSSLPAWIIARASDSEELSPGAGVWIVTVGISLHLSPNDVTTELSREIWDKTLQVLNWDNLATRLSELEDFHCYGVVRDNPRQKETTDQTQLKSFKYTCHCMAMDHP